MFFLKYAVFLQKISKSFRRGIRGIIKKIISLLLFPDQSDFRILDRKQFLKKENSHIPQGKYIVTKLYTGYCSTNIC